MIFLKKNLKRTMNFNKKDAFYYYKQIKDRKKQGLWWQVVELYEKIIDLIYEPNKTLLIEYIYSLEKMKSFNKIVKTFEKIEKKFSLTSDEYFLYAYSLEKINQKELSAKKYAQAISLDSTKNAKKFGKGVFFEAKGDWYSALKEYQDYFKDKKLSTDMSYKLAMAYDRCYFWSDAEGIYLDAILNSNETINFYHRLGIVQERQKKYNKAIESYLVAVLKSKQHLAYFYYRIGYCFSKLELYKEACEAFLIMKNSSLSLDKNESIRGKNGTILYQYLLENYPLSLDKWLEFANRAKKLKVWRVAEYAYREYIDRSEEFNSNIYFLLANSLVQQQKYKEATEFFIKQRVLEDAHGLIEKEYHSNKSLQKKINYTEYYSRFELQDNLIVYESYRDRDGYSFVEEIFLYLQKNIQFEEYKHIWVLNRFEEIDSHIKEAKNIIFVSKDSDLYMRYINKSKYIIHNTPLSDYFIKKDGQIVIDSYNRDISIDNMAKSIFFKTHIFNPLENRKKSILIYGGSFLPNGITVSFLNLMKLIDRDRYDITLVIDRDRIYSDAKNIEQFSRLDTNGIKIVEKKSELLMTLEEKWIYIKFNTYFDLASDEMWDIFYKIYQREFRRIFGDLQFDLIINFEGYSQYWTRVLGSITDTPKVLYLHNDMLSEAKVKYPYLYANFKIYKNYDRLISVSKDSNSINQNSLDIDKNRFEYVINPIDINSIIEKSKEPIPFIDKQLFENSKVFINIARLSPEKGHIRLIKAFYRLTKVQKNIKLLILGQGALEDTLKELIETLSLQDKVFLLGYKSNPLNYLKLSDCFVLSSNHEGQGLVILEAMILNKYIISTDIEGPRELLSGGYGDLVNSSEDGLYSGMLRFLETPLNLKFFNAQKYNQNAIDMFNNKVLSLVNHPKENSLLELYKRAINDFNNKKWKDSLEKFTKIKETTKYISTLYYIKESKVMYLIENEGKSIDDILIYLNHKFDSESFAGVLYALLSAKDNSNSNSKAWEELYLSFLPVIEYIKIVDGTLDDLLDKRFLSIVSEVSNKFFDTLEADLMPYQVWFVFANIFILIRDYKKYQLAREKALESIILTKRIKNVRFARYKINSFAERGYTKEYNTLRDTLLKRDSSYIIKNLLLLGNSELYFNRANSMVNFYKKYYSPIEKEFSRYISGKSVAIIGPVNSGLDIGDEIDSFDIVVRFNYMGMEKFSQKSFGKKADISFYISQLLFKDKIDTQKIAFMNELDWIIVDTDQRDSDISFLGVIKPIRQRFYVGHPHINPLFKGTPSGIQRAVMDLLRFDIKRLKVFNTNLFLQNNYAKAYKSHGKLGIDYYNFIRHDPISNFVFLKRLKEFNIIETDSVLDKILDMSEKEYIEELQNQYGYKNKIG